MGRAKRARRGSRYSEDFKLSAVRLSRLPGVQVNQVAGALDIRPFMLSKWRKEVRDGAIRGKSKKVILDKRLATELRQLSELRMRYALLKEEHELLKKATRFCSQAKRRSLPSSTLRTQSIR